jgi:hypothetical protein
MAKVDNIISPLIQSGYTYLQAAGSDGSDKTTPGRHLRWDFLRALGENHLAKGKYARQQPYISESGYNRDSDFIKIYKSEFLEKKYFININFEIDVPKEIITEITREWHYSKTAEGLEKEATEIHIRFTDIAQYDQIKALEAKMEPLKFISFYKGIVEIEPQSKLSFYFDFNVKLRSGVGDKPGGYLRTESVCITDTVDFSTKQVNCRKKFTSATMRNKTAKIICENIQYVRFDYYDAIINEINIITYTDYISGVNKINEKGGWDFIGDFALSTDDTVASERFMADDVDGKVHWPKFNDSNASTGLFTVNKKNYANRWRRSGYNFNATNARRNDINGLQHFVHTYMQKSAHDTRAMVQLPSDDTKDLNVQTVSYLDMLRLISLDFHVARMLGLGHIDKTQNQKDKKFYVYCLEYKTYKALEAPLITNEERTHLYMTIPTGIRDYRLPAKPSLANLSYGISVDNGTDQLTALTDDLGYTPSGNVRFININRMGFNYEKPFGPFFYDPTEFCLCEETQAIAYGLEYKEISEANYRIPELSHDTDYLDSASIPETMPIIETGKPTLYTHQEKEEGTHAYAAYGINWFSRVSNLSNAQQTTTTFPKHTHLLPPFNFAVQLIQDEDPSELVIANKTLILTTPAEQSKLKALTSRDKTLVRVSFDWNHVHHNAHQYADYAELFFRKKEPLVVKGKISSISSLPNNKVQVNTIFFTITSTNPVTLVQPEISPSDAQKFVGSFFSSGNHNYQIESVITSGNNPTFIIKKIKQVQASPMSATNTTQFISSETYLQPNAGDLFFAIENMSALSNWDLKHNRKVYLEKFYTNAKVGVRYSPARVVYYDINTASLIGTNTEIKMEQHIELNATTGVSLEYSIKRQLQSVGANQLSIEGDFSADLILNKKIRIFGSKNNDAVYTVISSTTMADFTNIDVLETIPNATTSGQYGIVEFVVNRPIESINNTNNSFILLGDKRDEIEAAHIEFKKEDNGSFTRFVVGGINDKVKITPVLDALNKHTGFFEVHFNRINLRNHYHVDKEVKWYKGLVRLVDKSGNKKPYPVTFIGNSKGTPTTKLTLVVQDPEFITDTITGGTYSLAINSSNAANYHPSYKLYIETDQGINPITGSPIPIGDVNFDKNEILPDLTNANEGNRQTYMSIRSIDVKNNLDSYVSSPVVLLAQKISEPIKPDPPKGPLYATRPDFYGKSTYTFDTELLETAGGRIPYSVVFYRSSEDRILDVLYSKSTQEKIWEQLNLLPGTKTKFDPELWKILFKGDNSDNDSSVDITLIPVGAKYPTPPNGFKTYATMVNGERAQFTWPLPDNDEHVFPFERTAHLPIAVYKPFLASNNFNLNQPPISIYDKIVSVKKVLSQAIMSVFLPMTEQPPMFSFIKIDTQTSSEKIKPRDTNGNLLDGNVVDLFPMIKKLPPTIPPSNTILRFTDYTLDGSSKSLYFYLALEMSDKFKFSEASLPIGPVLLVNALPADKPQVRKVNTILQNSITNTPTSVLFEINEYLTNDMISKIEIYRAYNELDAKSIRTMTKAKSINWGDPIIDDFSDLHFPAYGEKLHYRLIAIRQVEDVTDVVLTPALTTGAPTPTQITFVPSRPSDIAFATVVDTINPLAPRLYSGNGMASADYLQKVILKWNSTCYNGTYRLQKLNSSGNWVEFYSIKMKDGDMQYPPLDHSDNADFTNYDKTNSLPRLDESGNAIYHRFRLHVENSSGLFNLNEHEVTLAKGASDLQEIDSFLSYKDGGTNNLTTLTNSEFVTGVSKPNQMTFTHVNKPLPAGHNSFTKVEIIVTNGSNSQTLSIVIAGGSVSIDATAFPNLSLPNQNYSIKTKLFTDFADKGAVQIFSLNYLAGPAYDLKKITNLVKLTDATHDVNLSVMRKINDGVAFPTHLKFTSIVDLSSISQTFDRMEITVNDRNVIALPKIISTINGNTIFTIADGIDVSTPNLNYEIKVKLFTVEAPLGNESIYNISYTYTPCDDIRTLINLAGYKDANSPSIIPIANKIITAFTNPNGSVTINESISTNLPVGHTFDHMDVILEDDIGEAFIKSINVANGNVVFNNTDGGLDLINAGRTYFITLVLYTNLCSNGASYVFSIKYG